MADRAILLASDHAGFELKRDLVDHLRDLGWEPIDLGTDSAESTDYPDHAQRLAESIVAGRAPRGILCCGSGTGMAIAANRYGGVRAANCLDERMARQAREHNDVNVLCLGARLLEPVHAKKIVWSFLDTEFAGGRHGRRVEKIDRGAS